MNHLSEKIKRAATSFLLPVDETREGNCKNCGACCMFLYKCPFLDFGGNTSHQAVCTIHRFKPPCAGNIQDVKQSRYISHVDTISINRFPLEYLL